MTRKGTTKSADRQFGGGRHDLAKAYVEAARLAVEAVSDNQVANPAVSLIVHAAIAYADALTAKAAGFVNTQDHTAATKSLRAALRDRLPQEQERRFARIIAEKAEAEYGVRAIRGLDAARLLGDLQKFAAWCEDELKRL
jgi:hypothetical protein